MVFLGGGFTAGTGFRGVRLVLCVGFYYLILWYWNWWLPIGTARMALSHTRVCTMYEFRIASKSSAGPPCKMHAVQKPVFRSRKIPSSSHFKRKRHPNCNLWLPLQEQTLTYKTVSIWGIRCADVLPPAWGSNDVSDIWNELVSVLYISSHIWCGNLTAGKGRKKTKQDHSIGKLADLATY